MKFPNIFIVFLVLFEFTVYMANDLIMPGMIQLVHEFRSSENLVPLSLSIYILGGMLLQWIIGPISDRLGRRPTMLFGCFFFSLFTLLISLSFSMSSYLTMRLFQGMGLSFIAVCGYASVQDLFEEKKAVRVVAWMSTVAVLAPVLGPILGGFLVDLLNWRWVFIILLACSLVSAVGLWKSMPESITPRLMKQNDHSHINSLTKGARQALQTYLRILKNGKVILGACLNGLMSAPILCWISVSPIILFEQAQVSPEIYGLVQVPIFGFFIVGNSVLRKLTHTLSLEQILKIGAPICLASVALFGFVIIAFPNSYWSFIGPLSLYCFGSGILSAPLTRKTLFASSEAKGSVSAVFQFISSSVQVACISMMPLIIHTQR